MQKQEQVGETLCMSYLQVLWLANVAEKLEQVKLEFSLFCKFESASIYEKLATCKMLC